jgi:hypothetical protein
LSPIDASEKIRNGVITALMKKSLPKSRNQTTQRKKMTNAYAILQNREHA